MANRMFRFFGPALLAGACSLTGCKHDEPPATPQPRPAAIDFAAPLPPGELALRKLPPGMYPAFTASPAELAAIHPAIQHSLEYLAKPSSGDHFPYADITHDRAVATLLALDEIALTAASGAADSASIDARIRRDFEVYQSIGAPTPDGGGYSGRVLFTGYFTPVYDASLTRTSEHQWPLYKRPGDLVSDPVTGDVKGRRTDGGQIVPYYTRSEVESGKLAGQELVWLKSRWEAYVVTVQGSGRLRLTDGRVFEVGYAGNNGYPYASVAARMKSDGALPPDQLNLKGMKAYFDAHPADMEKYLTLNQRTVFFAERPGGPYGKLNVPVTPMGTIATDKADDRDVYPRAMPAFLVVSVPTPEGGDRAFRGFLLDQDTGGAIRASGRCDVYMGVGPAAEQIAGHELSEGKLYYVALKPELVGKYVGATTKPAGE